MDIRHSAQLQVAECGPPAENSSPTSSPFPPLQPCTLGLGQDGGRVSCREMSFLSGGLLRCPPLLPVWGSTCQGPCRTTLHPHLLWDHFLALSTSRKARDARHCAQTAPSSSEKEERRVSAQEDPPAPLSAEKSNRVLPAPSPAL